MDPKYSHIVVPIEAIDLHVENPRFDPVEDQRAAMAAVCQDQQEKLVVLADHIAKNGTSPIDLLFVVKGEEDNRFISAEGNRRLTALKLLSQPTRIEGVPLTENQKKKLRASSKIFNAEQHAVIPCALSPDHESAAEWIRLRHTGENEGAGVVTWNGTAVARFSQSRSHGAINFIKGQLGAGFDESILERFPISTFERLIDDPDIRAALGLSFEGGTFFTDYDPKQVAANMYAVMNDLRKDRGKANTVVTNVKTKDQRIAYLNKMKPQFALGDPLEASVALDAVPGPDTVPNPSNGGDGGAGKEKPDGKAKAAAKSKGSKPSVKNRSVLIPRGTTFPVESTRVNEIYRELRTLNIIQYPNAGAVLARVFLECSADAYIKFAELQKDLQKEAGGGSAPRITLQHKLSCVKKHLIANGADRAEINSAHAVFASKNSPFSVQHLHSCVHDNNWHPDGSGLIRDWDICAVFFVEIWNRIK